MVKEYAERKSEFLDMNIKQFGTSSHIILPKWAEDKKAKVIIYEKSFKCKICDGTFPEFEESEEKGVCKQCFEIKNNLEENRCLTCKNNLEKENEGILCLNCIKKFKGHTGKIPSHITPYLLFKSREDIKELFEIKKEGGSKK